MEGSCKGAYLCIVSGGMGVGVCVCVGGGGVITIIINE